jgi:uncharacterized membrane protein YccC
VSNFLLADAQSGLRRTRIAGKEIVLPFCWRDWLFSLKTFCAAGLALYIALWADLSNPYWALGTVYVVSQNHAGETLSKSFYRFVGTIAGASASVVLVPNLASAPVLLNVAMAAWVGACLYFAVLDRTPRSYAAILAGITAAVVGFPSVSDPGGIFEAAVARSEEIFVGIACAALVSALVFPRSILPSLVERIDKSLLEIRRLAVVSVEGHPGPNDFFSASLRQAGDAVSFEQSSHHLSFEGTEASRQEAAQRLRAYMLGVLPVLSSVLDRTIVLKSRNSLSPRIACLLAEIKHWLVTGMGDEKEANEIVVSIRDAAPSLVGAVDWDDVLAATLAARLESLVDARKGTREAFNQLSTGLGAGRPESSFEQGAHSIRHRDHLMAGLSAASAAATILSTSAFWVLSGWPDGAAAPMMGAVVCCLFATFDDPVPAISAFVTASMLGVVVAGFCLFVALPLAATFEMLLLVLAPGFLLCGLLICNPKTSVSGMAAALFGATALSLSANYSADLESFANSNIAILIGMWSGAVVTALIRSVDVAWSAQRLLRFNRLSASDAASTRDRRHPRVLAALMLDRLGLAASKIGSVPGRAFEARHLLAQVNVAVALRTLHLISENVSTGLRDAIRDLNAAIRAHYQAGYAEPSPAVLSKIDEALSLSIASLNHTAPQVALAHLVEVRRELFPASWPPNVRFEQQWGSE